MNLMVSDMTQLCGLVAFATGLVLTFRSRLAAPLIIAGILAWVIGRYIRRKGPFGS